MIQGSIGIHGKFRLWDEMAHPAHIDMTAIRKEEISSHSLCMAYRTSTRILEVMIPRGAHVMYGLLGVCYLPDNNEKKIKLFFSKSKSTESVYSKSLIDMFEKAKVGLPDEYVEAAINGVNRANNLNAEALLRGNYEFSYAAFGDVSSNKKIFEKLSFSLAFLVTKDFKEISTDLVNSLIEN